ncbi:SDR family NAD(P)-dependent oxidoreductase [Micromonospora endolithica]|uniref:SDR family oxidoreductase n=1 Tax=Micromonospora endolithica TaxID=230091 RepID=A0A3A9YQI8_9ACTN|nr:SDR family NAD(P)-dependent oxidoreductase [Micromonospora endolithica]RKN38233.1 SDR family oxidoreductase [Micromonospora endolithica]TWJ25217.1 NAD(P)-dependent dehydrogenase (short-subunit alcohol dehydrogenase family) [Micromonospora endolithica]
MTRQHLTGKVALITGAARGIGRAIAISAAQAGADVALLDIAAPVAPDEFATPSTPDDLAAVRDTISALGRRTAVFTVDVRHPDAMREAVRDAVDRLGGLHLVAINAGVAGWVPLSDMTPQQWQTVIDVNLTGAFHTLSAVTPYLTTNGQGRIVAISSLAGRRGMENLAHYAASKWGLIGLVKSAALELGPHGVTVNAVAPTLVDTNTAPEIPSPDLPASHGDAMPHAPAHALPVTTVAVDDVAEAVMFLFSDNARHISGAVLDITAGASGTWTA